MIVDTLSCLVGKKYQSKFSFFSGSEDSDGGESTKETGDVVLSISKENLIYSITIDFNISANLNEFNTIKNRISYNKYNKNLYVVGIQEEDKKFEMYGIIFNLKTEITETKKWPHFPNQSQIIPEA